MDNTNELSIISEQNDMTTDNQERCILTKKISEIMLPKKTASEPIPVNRLEKEYFQNEINSEQEESLEMTLVDDIKKINEKIVLTSNFQFKEAQLKNFEGRCRYMSMNREFLGFINEDKNILFIKNLKNTSLTRELKRNHPIYDFAFLKDENEKECSLLACSDTSGCLVVWALSQEKLDNRIIMLYTSSDEKAEGIENTNLGQKIIWKNRKTLATFSGKEICLWEIADFANEINDLEPSDESPRPSRFNRKEFNSDVNSVQFSNNISILYACFADNTIKVINLDVLCVIREFQPYSDDKLVGVLPFRNMKPSQDLSSGVAKENNMIDIFITTSANHNIKVWDYSQWDSKNKAPFCIETLDIGSGFSQKDTFEANKKPVLLGFDMSKSFLIIICKSNEAEKIYVFEINKSFMNYTEKYYQIRKTERFFNHRNDLEFKRGPIIDFDLINIKKAEHDIYFQDGYSVEHVLNEFVIDFSVPCDIDIDLSVVFFTSTGIYICNLPCDRLYPSPISGDHEPPFKIKREKKKASIVNVNKIEEELERMAKDKKLGQNEPKEESPEQLEQNNLQASETLPKPSQPQNQDNVSIAETPIDYLKMMYGKPKSISTSSTQNPNTGALTIQNTASAQPSPFFNIPAGFPYQQQQPLQQFQQQQPLQQSQQQQPQKQQPLEQPQQQPQKQQPLEQPQPQQQQPLQQPQQQPLQQAQHQQQLLPQPQQQQQQPAAVQSQPQNQILEKIADPSQRQREEFKIAASSGKKGDNTPEKSQAIKDKKKKNPKPQVVNQSAMILGNKPPVVVNENPKKFIEDNNDVKLSNLVERKIIEKLETLNQNEITSMLKNDINLIIAEGVSREFKNQFENNVTPCFEKYLKTMYEQVNKTYEKGYKFYQDKINIEETKGSHIKESLREAMNHFSQMACIISEQALSNQKEFKRMESVLEEKRQDNNRAIKEQLEKIANNQVELERQIAELNKNIQPLLNHLSKHAAEQEEPMVKSESDSEDTQKENPQQNMNQQQPQITQAQQQIQNLPHPNNLQQQMLNNQKMMMSMGMFNHPGNPFFGTQLMNNGFIPNWNNTSADFMRNSSAAGYFPFPSNSSPPFNNNPNMFGINDSSGSSTNKFMNSGMTSSNIFNMNNTTGSNTTPTGGTNTAGVSGVTGMPLNSSIRHSSEGFEYSGGGNMFMPTRSSYESMMPQQNQTMTQGSKKGKTKHFTTTPKKN